MKCRILIVEDRPELRTDLEKVLKKLSGCETEAVRNEIEAIERIQHVQFSIIIADVDLSLAGGREDGGFQVVSRWDSRGNDFGFLICAPVVIRPDQSAIPIAQLQGRICQFAIHRQRWTNRSHNHPLRRRPDPRS